MISVDSNKITVPLEVVKRYSPNSFVEISKTDIETGEQRSFLQLKPEHKTLGLKSISISETEVIIETSAKLLHEKYLSGLTQNTFEQFVYNLNETELITFIESAFIDTALFQRFDVTTNIYPINPHKSLLDLQVYSANNRYNTASYKTGISITSLAKTLKERLIAYLKYDELSRNLKSNKDLLQYVNLEDSKGIFRVESNLKNYERIRGALKVTGNRFFVKDILASKVNPNYEAFIKMFNTKDIPEEELKGKNNMSSLIELGYKHHQLEKELGMRQIIINCNYDMLVIKKVLKQTIKGNTSRYVKKYKDLLDIMRCEKLDHNVKSIKEIEQLLKAS